MKARTERVDGLGGGNATEADRWFLSTRRELRGWGDALAIDLPAPWADHLGRVADALAEIDTDDEAGQPGCGPVAFAALPFDRSAGARFVVPSITVGTTPDGQRWRTTIDDALPAEVERAGATAEPPSMRLAASCRDDEWMATVTAATDAIAAARLTKVVLARRIVVEANAPLDPITIAARLAEAHPDSYRFCLDGFVGATPELLVSRIGDVVRARPMAGTTPRSGDPHLDASRAAELLASAKNRAEHQITIDMVHDTLLPWCSYLDAEPEPRVAAAGSVQHLATTVEGRLSHPAPSVLELVAALHPTPAVGGWPTAPALALIDELEPAGRGRYAGPVGWVDRDGNGAFAVGIRSAEIVGSTATVFAGVGVVADSDPYAELEETRAKFAATLPSIIRI